MPNGGGSRRAICFSCEVSVDTTLFRRPSHAPTGLHHPRKCQPPGQAPGILLLPPCRPGRFSAANGQGTVGSGGLLRLVRPGTRHAPLPRGTIQPRSRSDPDAAVCAASDYPAAQRPIARHGVGIPACQGAAHPGVAHFAGAGPGNAFQPKMRRSAGPEPEPDRPNRPALCGKAEKIPGIRSHWR